MAIKVDNFQILHNMETEKRIKQFTVAENLVVKVEPSKEHEFLMTTEEVANGYGVSGGTVRKHRLEHNEELIEGKHFILVENTEMNGATKSNADRKSAYYKKFFGPSAVSSASASSSSQNVRSCFATGRKTW